MIRNDFSQSNLQSWSKPEMMPNFQLGDAGSNPADCIISISKIDSEEEIRQAGMIIKTYHSYKPSDDFVARRIFYWIKADKKIIGVIVFGNSFYTIGCRDSFIGWNDKAKKERLDSIANNIRYCLMPHKIKNVTSKVFHLICKQLPIDWFSKYGDRCVAIETLIEPPYEGKSYKASGFQFLGKTKGQELNTVNIKDLAKFGTEGKEYQIIQKNVKFGDKKGASKYVKILMDTQNEKLYFIKFLHRHWKNYLNQVEKIEIPKEITQNQIREVMKKDSGLISWRGAIQILKNRLKNNQEENKTIPEVIL